MKFQTIQMKPDVSEERTTIFRVEGKTKPIFPAVSVCFFLGLPFDPEDGGENFARIMGGFSLSLQGCMVSVFIRR
jgi:hypothetical protein